MILLVFAGSAAEFALNRAVDWLFFTGKVPNDPIGRLFATARYAQEIVFADDQTASRTLERIRLIHQSIEKQRGSTIPDWAHRDVLYMLIDYSERAHALLARRLTNEEQDDLYDVFYRVGRGLGVQKLPPSYREWSIDRRFHLQRDLERSNWTHLLYRRYRQHLGAWRYRLLLRAQAVLVPQHVRDLLRLRSADWLRRAVRAYPLLVRAGLRSVVQQLLMPPRHLAFVRSLDANGDRDRRLWIEQQETRWRRRSVSRRR